MRFFTETFAAGETKNFAVRGGYFKLFSSTNNVDLKFFAGQGYGQPTRIASSIPAGFAFKPLADEFSGLLITSATAQAVTFIIADSDTSLDRLIGDVSVIDMPGTGSQILTLNASSLAAGFVADQMLAPAANTNGVKLHGFHLTFTAGATSTGACGLIAKASAPASFASQAAAIELAIANVSAVGQTDVAKQFDAKRRIPAGWGIYLATQSNAAASLASSANITIEIL